ncbi:MAG TPA: molybdenum cofactor guanylyltransferase [Oceanospirillales bacterium]|nr:molybdenum cofactor guanylyltransferase [Oceanospirillales bacterium]
MNKIAGVVLAGGKSSRMGSDKSALTLNGIGLLEHMQSLLESAKINDVFVSGKQGIVDLVPNQGPLMAILSCLKKMKQFHRVLFIPVDMPLLTPKIIKQLTDNICDDFVCYDGFNLPLLIKNTQTIRTKIDKQIMKQQRSIHALLGQLNGNYIKRNCSEKHFINTNTPQQWQQAIKYFTTRPLKQ